MMAGLLVLHEDEADAVPGELRIERGQITAFDSRAALDPLKILLEVDLIVAIAVGELRLDPPLAPDTGRHNVQKVVLGDRDLPVRYPVGKCEIVGDDARRSEERRVGKEV